MKPSRQRHCCEELTDVFTAEDWKCYDNCPVCRMMRRAAEENSELSGKEVEAAFSEAEVRKSA